jgi:hypothetical protein
MKDEIINKVEQSGLIQFDLASHWPADIVVEEYDLSHDLWQGLAVKEKAFRSKLKETDWSFYANKHVALHCSADAIVPIWAYMLVTKYLNEHATKVTYGTIIELNNAIIKEVIESLDIAKYRDSRIIIKGCADLNIDESAYVELMNKLQPVAKSIMFGEPCSTVPLFKRK